MWLQRLKEWGEGKFVLIKAALLEILYGEKK